MNEKGKIQEWDFIWEGAEISKQTVNKERGVNNQNV